MRETVNTDPTRTRAEQDRAWAAANLPDPQRDQWRALMAPITNEPERAERLHAHGITPDQVRAARAGNHQLIWPDTLRTGTTPYQELSADDIMALLVLTDDAYQYHRVMVDFTREIRSDHLAELASRGRDYGTLGRALGVTRQYVQSLMAAYRRRN